MKIKELIGKGRKGKKFSFYFNKIYRLWLLLCMLDVAISLGCKKGIGGVKLS
jgi:hypothetical protein